MNQQTLERNPVFPSTQSHGMAAVLNVSSPAQDRQWISQTLSGDPHAYTHLVIKYKDRLFDLACRVLKDRREGEDILQDSFIQAYKKLNTFRHDSTFSTWIYAIVMNNLRNRLRKNKIIRWSSLDAPRIGRDDTYSPEIQHGELPMDVVTESKLDLEKIQQLITTFPLVYQSIFIMFYFQNLPLQEIASRLGRPLGTVKAYLHRSRKRLYKNYKEPTTPLPFA